MDAFALKQSITNELINAIDVGVVVLDSDFCVEVWNQFMENHASIKPADIVGQSLFSHFPEIDEGWLRQKSVPIFNLRSPVFIIWEQRQYLFKFGANRPVTCGAHHMYQNVTMFPIIGDNGEVSRFCIMVYDVTDQALSKLGMSRLNDELKVASRIDGLTGLFNRRYWQERFEQAYKLAKRREKPSTALMLDIDHFKKVNDTYGHQAGDSVIQSLAHLIKRCVRETDLAGRYGGEEFAVILTDSAVDNAVTVAERLRRLAEHSQVEHEGQIIKFNISVGLAEFSPLCDSPMEWLERADQALYQAKQTGRNKYCVWQEQ
ncbi:MAG TPA: sensor domain-containing diguanylate cyclase [Alteromonas australica]|jgi:diguanylate cyclase|uniref:diguanylate cyclase n=1 Tax=Alteromonas australica TaxID=589873 RepID=A0A075P344_9ALTE|nr:MULTISPECIES: diguanylate cyclase [Alteromonas]MAF72300.1 sensor domain-containing diguanylate cyclase [Alteromonas sp.]AIF97752.1 diguanylate cyclase [Alteromonas australica]MAO31812.1 sensor domain-containing diguanylate cyclase [Alteromonas sp.]MBU34588.1 sensor domain-containing diguanylate cyclase [Alteromonas sp.]QPL49523.1 sensor domain-containing diguanylate cyclase [Alteromonas sp. B31-7]|tara:strand:+ start:182 stop:1135 length:954 start_codon:yes stop_codon:yes gene_type:complete